MQDNNKGIDEITLEARKAYRFLFQYQRRILDLMRFIEGRLGLEYKGGFPKFSNPAPRNGGRSLFNWSWDWLNMYFYEFHFHANGNDTVRFSAFIVNDMGYYDSECATNPHKRLDVEDFKPVGDSSTKLIFVAGKDTWGSPKEWGEWQSQKFLNEDLVVKSDDGIMISKIYSLDKFATEDDAIQSLKEFGEYCHQHNIPIQYQGRTL